MPLFRSTDRATVLSAGDTNGMRVMAIEKGNRNDLDLGYADEGRVDESKNHLLMDLGLHRGEAARARKHVVFSNPDGEIESILRRESPNPIQLGIDSE